MKANASGVLLVYLISQGTFYVKREREKGNTILIWNKKKFKTLCSFGIGLFYLN